MKSLSRGMMVRGTGEFSQRYTVLLHITLRSPVREIPKRDRPESSQGCNETGTGEFSQGCIILFDRYSSESSQENINKWHWEWELQPGIWRERCSWEFQPGIYCAETLRRSARGYDIKTYVRDIFFTETLRNLARNILLKGHFRVLPGIYFFQKNIGFQLRIYFYTVTPKSSQEYVKMYNVHGTREQGSPARDMRVIM
jgi:hypothetical protein